MGLLVDITPLRQSRDFRLLWVGHLVSLIGRQITVVALPYQVYLLTRSPFAVGAVSLVQVVPFAAFSLVGGTLADRLDRRKLLLVAQFPLALTSGLLALGAVGLRAPLAMLYVVAGASAAISALESPTRSATVPRLVSAEQLPAAVALMQVLLQTAQVVGLSLGGLIIARFGLVWAYAIDAVTFLAAMALVAVMSAQPPTGPPDEKGLRALTGGLRYVRRDRVLLTAFAADMNAMVFGMPRALFPALADQVFHVGPAGLGLLNAAPGAGALVGAVFTGWVGRVHRHGAAVIAATVVWGAAIAAFGLVGDAFVVALLFLAVAGAADVVSAVFRGVILQARVPDHIRGRVTAVHIVVVTSGPRFGDVESGTVASLAGLRFSVVSGGLLCVGGAAVLSLLVPAFLRYRAVPAEEEAVSPVSGDGSPVDLAVPDTAP